MPPWSAIAIFTASVMPLPPMSEYSPDMSASTPIFTTSSLICAPTGALAARHSTATAAITRLRDPGTFFAKALLILFMMSPVVRVR
ncbi:hypothetical protein D9M72_652570 [compost metagenome]